MLDFLIDIFLLLLCGAVIMGISFLIAALGMDQPGK